jgi:acyl carrier protein
MVIEQQPDILEDRVQAFTAQHFGVKRNKLSTATRLNRDLGMDGDDAVEFFKDFGAAFKVNLDDLHARWDQHFGPEGGPSFGFLIIVVLCITAGFWLRDRLGLLPAWAWGIALIFAVILAYQFWLSKKMLPITVGDLVDSARRGRWSKSYTNCCNIAITLLDHYYP